MGITKRLKKKTGKRNPNGAIAGNEETGQEKKKRKEKKNGRVPRWVWYTRFALPLK
jgi:hypothetical protein